MTGNFSWAKLAIIAFALGTIPAAAKDRPTKQLKPTSAWNLDYAADSCRIARTFGTGADSSAFYLEQYDPGEDFLLLVAGGPLAGVKPRDISIQFGPAAQAQEKLGIAAEFGSFGTGFMVTGMSMVPTEKDRGADQKKWDEPDLPSVRAPESDISWVAFTKTGVTDLVLELGAMDKPMDALRACTDDLVRQWGIDAEAQKSRTRKVRPANNPGRWLVADDYPSELLRKGNQGVAPFRLIVGADGVPESCHIQKTSGHKAFDDVVCEKVMERARFMPALDANDQPIRSYYISTVRFAAG
ncbi:TonB family protein [Altererythrobacter confluentis]|uniref:TonB family protein n=1 Tax=Allopontixanthobacter confluentis TaxID=1849021 RepID=A0A6L7GGD1_9SPHN|nr:energy transducer TonB [Allopontixanthobacter confluentis]MXP15123.1 TonB family protein [Allopontixanthobacter confluentis]